MYTFSLVSEEPFNIYRVFQLKKKKCKKKIRKKKHIIPTLVCTQTISEMVYSSECLALLHTLFGHIHITSEFNIKVV